MNDPLKMQGRRLFRVGTAALFLVAAAAAFYPPIRGHYAFAAPKSRAGGPPHVAGEDSTTTLNDQTDLAVTVYNSNIALVRDFSRHIQAIVQRNIDDMLPKRKSIFWGNVMNGAAPPTPVFELRST